MEETELEEGEACSYHDNRDDGGYDSSVDPDLDLSYIDEKIQDVLGHFQKDFEGGVSAENLGAKFGGYGSFLPSYQRSPVSSHSRSPSKVRQDDAPKASKIFELEDGHLNTVVPTSESKRARHLTACNTVTFMPLSKDLTKKEGSAPSTCTGEYDFHYESANLSNREVKKVQRRMGPDKVSTRNKAAIYSGLGLDVSPSSSLEENHYGSEKTINEHQDAPSESPTSILQIMTSLPVPEDALLSPLPDNLLNFIKPKNALEDQRSIVVSGLAVHVSDYTRDSAKMSKRKQVKSKERNDIITAAKSSDRKASSNSNATEGNGSIMREKGFNDQMVRETLTGRLVHDFSGVEKPEVYPTGKFFEDIEVSVRERSVQLKKDNHDKVQEIDGIKGSSQEQDHSIAPPVKGQLSSGGKEKPKASRTQATDVSKVIKNIHDGESDTKKSFGKLDVDRDFQRKGKYEDFFGDMEYDEDQHEMVKQGCATLRSMSVPDDELRERSKRKMFGKLSTAETHLDAAPDFVNKNMQLSAKTRSLNDGKHSSMEEEDDLLQQRSDSSNGRVASRAIIEKVPKHSLEGGAVSKSKSKKRSDRDRSKSSKKARNMGISNDEACTSDHGFSIRRIGENSNSAVLPNLSKENPECDNEASFDVSAFATAGNIDFMVDHSSKKVAASVNNEMVEVRAPDEGEFIEKKRKTKESHRYPTSLSTPPSGGLPVEKYRVHLVENEHREGKVAVLTSKQKESPEKRRIRRIDEESGHINNVQFNNDVGSTDMASMKREQGFMQPPISVTSGPSKVSSSLKTKASFRDTRGCPPESSVLYSPRRSSKPDKLNVEKQAISEKHDYEDAAIAPIGGPCSNGEVGRSGHSRSDRKDGTCAAAPNESLESSILDPDRDNLSGNCGTAKVAPSPDICNHPSLRSGDNNFGHDNQYPARPLDTDKCSDGERMNEKVSSSLSKEKYRKSHPEGMEKTKLSVSFEEMQDYGMDNEGKTRDARRNNQENTSVKGDEVDSKNVREKDSAGKPDRNSKRKSQSSQRDARCTGNSVSSPNRDDHEFSTKKTSSRKADQVETDSTRERALALPDVNTSQKETHEGSSKVVSRSQSSNGVENLPASLSNDDDALKMARQIKKADHQNGNHQKSSRHFTSNGHKVRDVNAPSPVRRDHASHAAVNALKEAKDLKHLADRLKNGGSNGESIGLYFQAALKFLHGAALLETRNTESSKRGDAAQSIQIYVSTAKLCEFCAREYEKSKDMASAALAYKCMEVAYLKVVYSSHNNAGKDRQELQTSLKMIPPGESPSSASDVDNVNNKANTEKIDRLKDESPPQVGGSQPSAATKVPNLVRLLNFAQNVSSAMEASRKSRIAFSAASTNSSDPKFKEAIPTIRTALDYNFQDVEGLLRLVRLATEAISR